MTAPSVEVYRKTQELEAGHADLSEGLFRCTGAGKAVPAVDGRRHGTSLVRRRLESSLCETLCINILQSMGQAVYIYDANYRLIYWNQIAETLFGYSAEEVIGKNGLTLLVDQQHQGVAIDIIARIRQGDTFTGQFPLRHKMGRMLLIIVTLTPFYDDDGTLIGLAAVGCDAKPFQELDSSFLKETKVGLGHFFRHLRSLGKSRLGLGPEQHLQTAITSKLMNLATMVSNKIRPNMKTGQKDVFQEGGSEDSRLGDHDHHKDGNPNEGRTSEGDLVSYAESPKECNDEAEDKTALHKITSKAEAHIQKKAKRWPWNRSNQKALGNSHYGEIVQKCKSGSWFSFGAITSSSSRSSALYRFDNDTESLEYEILWDDLTMGDQIGQGSCGKVYRGLWNGLDVAVKVFSKHDYAKDATTSFKQEVSLMKRLRHPNMLLFMGAVTSPQRLCIISEFLPRGSLFSLLRRSLFNLDWRQRIHMALDIARGMNYLHNCNPPIIHRDLKTANLLVDKNWTVKVADFGLSRVKHETYLMSRTGKGTPQWMAPEVLRNEPANEKSDIYSFGVILWELATHKIPWDHLNPIQVIGAVGFMNQRLEIPNDIDPTWASMIEGCWQSDPPRRPTFQQLVEQLRVMQRQYSIKFHAARAASL